MESVTDASFKNPLRMSPSVTDPSSLPSSVTTNSTFDITPILSRMARPCLMTALPGNILDCQLCMPEVEKFFNGSVELSNVFDLLHNFLRCSAVAIRVSHLPATISKRLRYRFLYCLSNIFFIRKGVNHRGWPQPPVLPAAYIYYG